MSGFYFKPIERIFLNLSGGTVTGDTIFTEGLYAARLSGDTIYSGDTDLDIIIRNISSGLDDLTRVQPGTNISTGGTGNFPIVNLIDDIVLNSVYAISLSGDTLYSGNTDLDTIIRTIAGDSEDTTRIQGGTNINTGGTANVPIVNLDDDISLSSIFATNLSGNTLFSGNTDVDTIIRNIASGLDDVTRVQGGTNTNTGGTANAPIVNLDDNIVLGSVSADTMSAQTMNAGVLLSGGTDLYNIFLTAVDGNDITRVQPGTNINTGGTANNPIVNLDDDIVLNSINASTVSGDTFYSAGTSLETVIRNIAGVAGDITRVQPGTNTSTGGTDNFPSVNLLDDIALNSINASIVSGDTFYSAGTSMDTIIRNISSSLDDVTRVQGGTNINTGGTANTPIINLENNILLNSVSAVTMSASTYYGSGFNLTDIAHSGLTGVGNRTHQELDEFWKFSIGSILETTSVSVISSGGTVNLFLEKNGGGDLTLNLSGGTFVLDTTPTLSIELSAGTNISPQVNYVYIDGGSMTLTSSTISFPSIEHVPVATTVVQSESGVTSDGVYKLHVWTDHLFLEGDNGHLSHLNAWIRSHHATWISGVDLTSTITTNGGSLDNFNVATTVGVVRQLHEHPYPVRNTTDTGSTGHVLVINDPTTPYVKYSDLNLIIQDAEGTSLRNTNDRYNLVIWGIANEDDNNSHIIVNLPTGKYTGGGIIKDSASIFDDDKTANYLIPAEYVGVGFLIARLTVKYTFAGGGTLQILQNEDLRGQSPTVVAGGTIHGITEFADNVFKIFDQDDSSKEMVFQVSGLTTGNVRTYTAPDNDGILATSGNLSGINMDISVINDTIIFSAGTSVGVDNFTTAVTLFDNIAYFDRTDQASAYTLDLSSLAPTGGTDFYTTAATLNGNVLYFDRIDGASAYSVDLSSIVTSGGTGGSGGTIYSATEPSPATFSANTWARTTDYNLFAYDDNLSKWVGVNSDRIGGARNKANQNNIFLRYEDDTPYNINPVRMHGDYVITNVVASGRDLDSWNAHILTGTSVTTDSIYNLRLNTARVGIDNDVNVEVASGTSIYLYMSGSSVAYPKIDVYIRNR